jgi:hypothetical protein
MKITGLSEDKDLELNLSSISPSSDISTFQIKTLLEWAGMKLLSLPNTRIKPEAYRNNWPKYIQDPDSIFSFSHQRLRPAIPNGYEIDLLDKISNLILLVDKPIIRQILQARSLLNPISHRHIYHWMQIAELVNMDRRTIRRWHEIGLKQIIFKTNKIQISFFLSQIK